MILSIRSRMRSERTIVPHGNLRSRRHGSGPQAGTPTSAPVVRNFVPRILRLPLRLSTARSLGSRKFNDFKAPNLCAKLPNSAGSENIGLERTNWPHPRLGQHTGFGRKPRVFCGFRAAWGDAEWNLQIGGGSGGGAAVEPSLATRQ
jgi:hypothetical protein